MLQVTNNYSGPVGYSGQPSVPHLCCALVRNLGFSAITHSPSCSFYYIMNVVPQLLAFHQSQALKSEGYMA